MLMAHRSNRGQKEKNQHTGKQPGNRHGNRFSPSSVKTERRVSTLYIILKVVAVNLLAFNSYAEGHAGEMAVITPVHLYCRCSGGQKKKKKEGKMMTGEKEKQTAVKMEETERDTPSC